MPENSQGQFEKRLYLNTRIKSGGTYTTEGPHGLAFVEELNNYVTENQNTSITLGSSDHKVSILFDGPSTFVRDGIGISSSVPASTYNRLYNSNGHLYWNGCELGYAFNYINEGIMDLYLGKFNDTDACEYISITADEVRINDSALAIGSDGIEIASYESIIINGPYDTQLTFASNGIHLGDASNPCTTTIEGPSVFKNTLELRDLASQPYLYYNKLYSFGHDLYWGDNKLGYYINFINELLEGSEPRGLCLGKYEVTDPCDYVEIQANHKVEINDSTLVIGPNLIKSNANQIYFGQEGLQATSVIFNGPLTFNGTVVINGPIRSGLRLDDGIPSSTSSKLYNSNGDLYWNGTKLNGGGSTFNFIQEGGDWLRLGPSAKDVTVSGSRSVSIEGPNQSQIKLARDGISIETNRYDDQVTIFIQGPRNSSIMMRTDGLYLSYTAIFIGPAETEINNQYVQFGLDNFRTSVTFNGPTAFNGTEVIFSSTTAFNGPVNINSSLNTIYGLCIADNTPITTEYSLYNNNGELFWNGSKVGGSSYEHIVEVPDVLYFGWKGDAGTEIDRIETRGEYIETYFGTLYYDGYHDDATVTFDGISSFVINGPGKSNLVIGPDGVKIASNNTIIISGPSATQISLANNGIHLGQASTTCTITVEGPSIFKNTLKLDSLSSDPSDRSNKLYNKDGDLYWNYNKLAHTFYYVQEDASDLYLGKVNDPDYCPYVQIKADEVSINGTTIVAGPNEVRLNDSTFVVGPHFIKSEANEIRIGNVGVKATSVLFNGPVTFNGTAAFEGPINSGLQLDNNIPSSTTNRLYNNNGDLYWNSTKLNGGGSSYEHIVEDPNWLYLGWKGSTGTEIDHVETCGKEVGIYFDTLTCQGPTVLFDNIESFIIDGPGHSNLVIGPDGINIASNDTITINGPNASQILLAYNGIHLGSESNPCTITIEGPSNFKNTLELNSLSSDPSNRNSKLYNKNGDLYWEGTKLNGGGGSSYIHDDAGGLYLGKLYDSDYCNYVDIKADEVRINGSAFVAGPSEVRLYDTAFAVTPEYIESKANLIYFGQEGLQATSVIFNGPVMISDLMQFDNLSGSPHLMTSGGYLESHENNLYWNASKVTNSIIEVPYQDVADEPGKRGSSLTLENNTIYNFDPDNDVDISEINVKPWNTPQLHLYFNNTSSGKTKMTFIYPYEWKWINQSTPPSSSDFKEGYLYCIALRSVANPVYVQSSTTPPYNQEYIVIANIAYEVPVDV